MELYLCTHAFEEVLDISSLEELSDISITPPTVVGFLICSSELACCE